MVLSLPMALVVYFPLMLAYPLLLLLCVSILVLFGILCERVIFPFFQMFLYVDWLIDFFYIGEGSKSY